jgi:hypothetical protein
VEAIGLYRRALTLAPRGPRPLDWALRQQNNLGNALWRLWSNACAKGDGPRLLCFQAVRKLLCSFEK